MKSIHNFRDCGGYATTDGRHMRKGRLYRSGTLDDANAADLRTVQAIGLKTIVDLRGPREKKKELPHLDSVLRIDVPIELETRTREKVQPLMTKRGAAGEVIEILKQMYRDLADEAWPQAGELFKVLLNAEAYPLLIHCRAGKDRTGFMCALVEQAVSVERAAIFQDYCETNNHFGLVSPRMERFMKIMSLGKLQMENVRASLSAREEYLQAAFDQIDRNHGGMTAYLAKCGVTACEIETLHGLLVE
ncbi:MAG TPA: tyrosine-protein phosphatase [Anaerolineae bacterium]|nr:tyrosine-protein phosphatase [Anaerolineae bacterium]